jgi:hypothetical protein
MTLPQLDGTAAATVAHLDAWEKRWAEETVEDALDAAVGEVEELRNLLPDVDSAEAAAEARTALDCLDRHLATIRARMP